MFYAFAHPVNSEADIKTIQEAYRKQFYDARHHCFAWILGLGEQQWRANDDGEPAHSAGDPILGQIKAHGLTNTLVIVIRYFGGTKLGVGGLIQAYKTATEMALSKAQILEIFEMIEVRLAFSYEMLSQAERLVTDYDIEVKERDYQETCVISGRLKKDLLERFKEKTADLYSITIDIGNDSE